MKNQGHAALAVAVALSLSGCGGSDNGGGGGNLQLDGLNFSQASSLANQVIGDAEAAENGQPVTGLPSGTATYRGIADMVIPTSASDSVFAIGEVTVNVNYNTPQVTGGSIQDVIVENGDRLDNGSLSIGSAPITGSTGGATDTYAFDASLSGTIDGSAGSLTVSNGSIDGEFGGGSATHIWGFLSGDSNYNGYPESGGLDGEYGAERQ